MKAIFEPSLRSKFAVIGLNLGSGERTFPGSDGDLLRGVMASLTMSPHYIELRKDDYEDEVVPEEIKAEVLQYLKDQGIQKIFFLGYQTTRELSPSLTHKQTAAKLATMPFLTSRELGIQAATINHPRFVLRALKSNKTADLEYSTRIVNLVDNKPATYKISVNEISLYEFIRDIIPEMASYKGKIGLDFETNGVDPFSEDFRITLFSISIKVGDEHITWHMSYEDLNAVMLKAFENFIVTNAYRLWAFNCSFEMKVLWRWLGRMVLIQDAMVLITMDSSRSSLKDAVRRHLASDFWETEVHEKLEEFSATFKQFTKIKKSDPELFAKLTSGNGDQVSAALHEDKSLAPIAERHEDIIEAYGFDELAKNFTGYPHHWGAVPHAILGPYCCYDSAYGTILADKFEDKFRDGYPVYIRHPWLATVFEVYGIPYDLSVSTEEEDKFTKNMIESLALVIDKLDFPVEQKLAVNDILSWDLPYTVTWYTEKTRAERKRVIKTEGDRLEEIKAIFNPASNAQTTRDQFWLTYMDDEIEMATVLHAFITEMKNADIWPKVLSQLSTFDKEIDFYRSVSPDELMDQITTFMTTVGGSLQKDIQGCLVDAMDVYKSLYTGRFAKEVMEAQYLVHKNFLKVDIDNPETWSTKFEILFNLHKYKKLAKTVSTYIQGSIGKGSVYLSTYDPTDLTVPPIRGPLVENVPKDYVLKENEQWVFNVGFNSLSAITHRWSSGAHTIPSGSSVRRMLVPRFQNGLWVHADFSQAELVILAFFSQDPKMLEVFLTGGDMHRYVASQVFQKPPEQVTGEERRGAKAVSFGIIYGKSIEATAVEVFGGNVERTQAMFDAFFKQFPAIRDWMNARYSEVDNTGKVTNLFGAFIAVETDAPGNAKYRQGCNYPIQSTSSMVAGTSMYNLHEHCVEEKIEQISHNFTHDALDAETLINQIFEYIKALQFKLQDEIYAQLGAPMRIDFEVGVNCYNICGLSHVKHEDNKVSFELEGTEESVNLLLAKFNEHSKWRVVDQKVVETKPLFTSFEEMFLSKSAYKSSWGVTENIIECEVVLEEKIAA